MSESDQIILLWTAWSGPSYVGDKVLRYSLFLQSENITKNTYIILTPLNPAFI